MTYTEEQKALLQELEQYIEECGSAAEAGRRIGYSDTVISQIRKGTYEGKTDKVFKKLSEYFEIKKKAAALPQNPGAGYAETSVSSEIYKILNLCQVKGGLAIACGDAGIGKTKAVMKYRKDHENGCISITMNTCCASVKSLLRLIATRVNAQAARSNDEIWFSIAEKLSDGMILIVDEAQHLTFSQLEVLRSFSDYFDNKGSTFGVALVGSPEIVSNMGERRNEYAQIINRCEITKIYKAADILREDIQKIFPAVADSEKELNFLWEIAKSLHGIRGAVKLYNTARQGENCTYEGLAAAAQTYMNIRITKV